MMSSFKPSNKQMLCRMTRCCSWNLHSLIVLLLYIIMNAYCYSCEEGRQQFSTCNCQVDDSTKCVTEVLSRDTFHLTCCLNASEGISWYKEIISSESKISYNNKTMENYTTNATKIKIMDLHPSKKQFKFTDGGKTFKIYEARASFNGTYICVAGGQQYVQYLDVHPDYARPDAKLLPAVDPKCPSEVEAHISEEQTLCCKFKISARVDNISIKWFFENAMEPLKTENNYSITSECNESTLEGDDATLSTVVKTFLKLSRVTRASYGNYTAEVNVIPYNKQTKMTSKCVLLLYKKDDPKDNKETFCCGLIVIASIITVTFAMIFVIVIYTQRKPIALLWSYYFRTLKDDPQNKQFDAFISHSNSSNDFDFVYDSLIPFLKDHKFSYCVRDINFLPGGDVFDDSTVAVKESLQTILILSPKFIEDSQCVHEFEVALRKSHKIIPIILQDMTRSQENKVKHLKWVLRFVKKLRWVEEKSDSFLKKLLELMPQKRTNSNLNSRFFNSAFTSDNIV